MTARLAHRNLENERLIKISDRIAREILKPFYLTPERAASAEPEVSSIVHRALELDLEMSEQRAFLQFSYLGCPHRYREDIMHMANSGHVVPEASHAGRGRWEVDVFLAPMLRKRGTADGDRYELEEIILPAEVLCSLPHSRRGPSPEQHSQRATPAQARRAASPEPSSRVPVQTVQRASTMPANAVAKGSITRVVPGFGEVQFAAPLEGGISRSYH